MNLLGASNAFAFSRYIIYSINMILPTVITDYSQTVILRN